MEKLPRCTVPIYENGTGIYCNKLPYLDYTNFETERRHEYINLHGLRQSTMWHDLNETNKIACSPAPTFQGDNFAGRVHDGRVRGDGPSNGIRRIRHINNHNLKKEQR